MSKLMKRVIKSLFLPGLLLVSFVCFSQEDMQLDAESGKVAKEEFTYGISVEPLYLFNAGLRLNFETLIKGNPRQLLQVSAIGYYNDWFDDGWETLLIDHTYGANKIIGGGIGADYKLFPSPKLKYFYVSGGVSYHYFNLNYDDYKMVSFVEDGLTFYESVWTTSTMPFNKIGANICLGLQSSRHKLLFTDVYLGAGYSYGFFDKEKYNPGNTMHSIGYRGITLLLGFRFGFRFGKVY